MNRGILRLATASLVACLAFSNAWTDDRYGGEALAPAARSSSQPLTHAPAQFGFGPDVEAFVRDTHPDLLKQSASGIRFMGQDGQTGLSDTHAQALSLYAYYYARNRVRTLNRKKGGSLLLVMAGDPRPSALAVREALLRGFRLAEQETGVTVRVENLDVLTTPLAESAVRLLKADGGVMITASHNPLRDNGIKFLTAHNNEPGTVGKGALLEAAAMHRIIAQFQRIRSTPDRALFDRLRTRDGTVPKTDEETVHRVIRHYIDELRRAFPQMNLRTLLKTIAIAVDTNGGSGALPMPGTKQGLIAWILTQFGLQVHEVKDAHGQPIKLGQPQHRIEPVGEAMDALKRLIQAFHLAFGIGFDYDADRGNTEPDMDPQAVTAFSVMAALSQMDAYHQDAGSRGVVIVVSDGTSRRVDDIVGYFDRPDRPVTIRRVETGEVNVVSEMQKARAEGYFVPAGIEGPAGGMILGHATCRDGIATALLTAVALADKRIRAVWAEKIPEKAATILQDTVFFPALAATVPARVTRIDALLGIPNERIPTIKRNMEARFRLLWDQQPWLRETYSAFEIRHYQTTASSDAPFGDQLGAWVLTLQRPNGLKEDLWLRPSRTGPEMRYQVDALDRESYLRLADVMDDLLGHAAYRSSLGRLEFAVLQAAKTAAFKIGSPLRAHVVGTFRTLGLMRRDLTILVEMPQAIYANSFDYVNLWDEYFFALDRKVKTFGLGSVQTNGNDLKAYLQSDPDQPELQQEIYFYAGDPAADHPLLDHLLKMARKPDEIYLGKTGTYFELEYYVGNLSHWQQQLDQFAELGWRFNSFDGRLDALKQMLLHPTPDLYAQLTRRLHLPLETLHAVSLQQAA